MEALEVEKVKICKPKTEWELRKFLDIVEALLDASELSLQNQRKDMFDVFLQKKTMYNPPRMAAMGFSPYCGQIAKKCNFFGESKPLQPEQKWSPHFFWHFKHGPEDKCLGLGKSPNTFTSPFYDPEGRVCYPCNTGYCHEKCPCEICSAAVALLRIEGNKHLEEHLEEYNLDCILAKVQCTQHYVDHPENFNPNEDIEIKVYNFLNMDLTEKKKDISLSKRVNYPPRTDGNLQETVKLAGLKRNCKACRDNKNDHVKNHQVLHSQCKICDIRSKTLVDLKFWDKTCPKCKIYFPTIEAKEMKQHIKNHQRDFSCNVCEKEFGRYKYLMQHKRETHNTDIEKWQCELCPKVYKQERNLKFHIKLRHSSDIIKISCRFCTAEFLYRFSLNRHLRSKHCASSSGHTNIFVDMKVSCKTCGRKFNSENGLNEHKAMQH